MMRPTARSRSGTCLRSSRTFARSSASSKKICTRSSRCSNARPIQQRLRQPRSQQAAAHRRARVIEHAEQGDAARRIFAAQRVGEFQVAARRRIERHEFAGGIRSQAGELRQHARLCFLQILHDRSGGAHGQRLAIQAKARQRRHLKMIRSPLAAPATASKCQAVNGVK